MKADDITSSVPVGARQVPVQGVRAGLAFAHRDWVAEETPVAFEFNGVSHAVMLASPLDLADFALGFSMSEGLLAGPHELYGVEEVRSAQGITLQLEIASGAFVRLKERRRTLAGRTGCGLCGTESLSEVTRPLPVLAEGTRFGAAALARAMRELAGTQSLQKLTGAVHAAAWCSAEGEVRFAREDVGRHNALDKLVGALVRAGIDARAGFIAITSRASFEMVQKAAMAGVTLLAAVSAPTALAVATAERARLTLAGFVRGDDLVFYTHPRRLSLDAAPSCTPTN